MGNRLTIIVPIFGEEIGLIAKYAVNSILLQAKHGECGIIVSNNGGNKKVREIFAANEYANKIHYLETPDLLSMAEHFEWASSKAKSDYFMVLPARRMLKQGAISKMIEVMDNNLDCEACCGNYEDWDESANRLFFNYLVQKDLKVAPQKLIDRFLRGTYISKSEFWSSLPTAMNGIVRTEFVNRLRNVYSDSYFGTISPDVAAGFRCLLNCNQVYLIASPIFITTNRAHSEGNKSILSFETRYLKSLGEEGRFRHVSTELNSSIYASIIEDYNRQMKSYALIKDIPIKDCELSTFFLKECAFENFLKLFNNPLKFSHIKIVYSASKILYKLNISYRCLIKKFILAFVASVYLRSPRVIRNTLFIFRGKSSKHDNLYIAGGFTAPPDVKPSE